MGMVSEKLVKPSQSKNDSGVELQTQKTTKLLADKALKYSSIFWFLAILTGQWFFFYYIMSFYGYSVINNNMAIWNRWEAFGSTPYTSGDTLGNLVFAVHAIGAGVVAFGGALQLVPKVRAIAPTFHKINGYVYLVTVMCLALSGFYLSWIKGASPDTLSAVGTSINGFLILTFAYLTVKTARNRDITSHRKWAIRLFLVSNAQWFLRVGVFSYFINGTMLGGTPVFGDIFFPFWTFGCFLLPLGGAQLYFYATRSRNKNVKYATAGFLVTMTLLMLVGVVGLTPFLLQVMSGEQLTL